MFLPWLASGLLCDGQKIVFLNNLRISDFQEMKKLKNKLLYRSKAIDKYNLEIGDNFSTRDEFEKLFELGTSKYPKESSSAHCGLVVMK